MVERSFGVAVLFVCALAIGGDLTPPPGPVVPTMLTLDTAEPRRPISQDDIPMTITAEGSYFLTENVFPPASVPYLIKVASNNVTLDLNGFTLIGETGLMVATDGILVGAGHESVTIFNGVVRNCADDCVDGDDTVGLVLRELRVSRSGGVGLFVGSHGRVESCVVIKCGSSGIVGEASSTIIDCVSHQSGGAGISAGVSSTLVRCLASEGDSSGITAGSGSSLSGCTARQNAGFGFNLSVGGAAESCTSESNSSVGFSTSGNFTFTGCSSTSNQLGGFSCGSGVALLNCVASFNGGYGFQINGRSQATSCVAFNNSSNGFELSVARAIDCFSHSNLIDGFSCQGAAMAEGCFSRNNLAFGVHLTNANNMVVRCRAELNSSGDYRDDGVSSRVGTIRTTPVGAGAWDNFAL